MFKFTIITCLPSSPPTCPILRSRRREHISFLPRSSFLSWENSDFSFTSSPELSPISTNSRASGNRVGFALRFQGFPLSTIAMIWWIEFELLLFFLGYKIEWVWEEVVMHWNRGGVGSKVEIGAVDRKRFGDTLDKHLEKSPPIASRVIDLKETDKLSGPSTSSGKQLEYPSLSNNKCSDGRVSSLLSCSILFFGFKLHFFFRLSNAACALRDYSFFL